MKTTKLLFRSLPHVTILLLVALPFLAGVALTWRSLAFGSIALYYLEVMWHALRYAWKKGYF